MAKPYRLLRAQMSAEAQRKAAEKARALLDAEALAARVWARQAPSSRWRALPPGAAIMPQPAPGSTKCTDALASEGQNTRLPPSSQVEPLCCGWWGSLGRSEQWRCITCGRVLNGYPDKTRKGLHGT